MAKIHPLRAWRYRSSKDEPMGELTAPLFDVVSQAQREKLYQNPHNSIHLSVPRGTAEEAAALLQRWKDEQVILQDARPSLYVYYQYFGLPGSDHLYVRKGFVCNILATDWETDPVVMRHENTIPHSVNDRVGLLEATELNVSPTHGLYSDPSLLLESYMDAAIENPIYDQENYQGVRDVMGIIDDPAVISKFVDLVGEQRIILADGHHRYESSMLYRKKRMAENPNHTGNEGYNYHLMYLTNMESDDLRILPTHRLIRNLPDFDVDTLLTKLSQDFHIREIENAYDIEEVILGKKYAFGLLVGDRTLKIRLKEERYDSVPWSFPDSINKLDLTVMHYFVIERALGIEGKDQRASRLIDFERSCAAARDEVRLGRAQLAIIMKDVSIAQVKEVCHSGYTMPQKSTYFYPKVISGYLFSSISDDDFTL